MMSETGRTYSKMQVVLTRFPLHKFIREMAKNYELFLFVLPAIVVVFIFNYVPMYGVQIAFKDFVPVKGIEASHWVGFKHFVRFFDLYNGVTVIKNTLLLSIYSLGLNFPAPILLALLLNQMRSEGLKRTIQTVTYMPHFISTVVIVGMLMVFLSPNTGLYGQISRLLGIEPNNILGNAGMFRTIYVLSDIWQHTGWNSIIYLAALSAVDLSLYEASHMDGANKLQRMIYIDIPCLVPTAIILLVLSTGNILNVGFDKAYLMQNDLNLRTSEVLSTYVYKIGIQSAQYSFSAAINLFNTIVSFFLLVIVNRLAAKFSETSLW
jgi:putative aldouronate transport system permease protein